MPSAPKDYVFCSYLSEPLHLYAILSKPTSFNLSFTLPFPFVTFNSLLSVYLNSALILAIKPQSKFGNNSAYIFLIRNFAAICHFVILSFGTVADTPTFHQHYSFTFKLFFFLEKFNLV